MVLAQSVIAKWGNSSAIRIPSNILKKANIGLNDTIFFDVSEDGNITLTKKPTPKKGTLEYLFKDYEGGSFQSELVIPSTPTGTEKW